MSKLAVKEQSHVQQTVSSNFITLGRLFVRLEKETCFSSTLVSRLTSLEKRGATVHFFLSSAQEDDGDSVSGSGVAVCGGS